MQYVDSEGSKAIEEDGDDGSGQADTHGGQLHIS